MKIDINADVGEGIGNESQLMPYLSSCNIACGGHSGNEETMQSAIEIATKNNVNIGAHPSFPDQKHFGRKKMTNLSQDELFRAIKTQTTDLLTLVKAKNKKLHHVKPHGALYNLAATDIEIARVIIRLMTNINEGIKLYVPFGSVIEKLALQNKVPIVYEVFADRNYNDNYTLVSRSHSEALLSNPEEVFNHVHFIHSTKSVKTITRNILPIKANTYCIHGDNEAALLIAKYLHDKLLEKNIVIDKLEND